MNALQRDFGARGVQVLAINSNSPRLYPDESYLRMGERATEDHYAFPYVADEGQQVAKAYGPTCTFHVFVLDRDRRLRYQGRFDDARLPERVTSHDLRNAIEDVLDDADVRAQHDAPIRMRTRLHLRSTPWPRSKARRSSRESEAWTRSPRWSRRPRHLDIAILVAGCWAILFVAELTGASAALHHHALIEGGQPLITAIPMFLVGWLVMAAAMMLPASLRAIHAGRDGGLVGGRRRDEPAPRSSLRSPRSGLPSGWWRSWAMSASTMSSTRRRGSRSGRG